MISPLPDNTQQSQETDIHAPAGLEPVISESERPYTYALDCAAAEVARKDDIVYIFFKNSENFEIFIIFYIFPLSVTDSQQVWIRKWIKAILPILEICWETLIIFFLDRDVITDQKCTVSKPNTLVYNNTVKCVLYDSWAPFEGSTRNEFINICA